MQSEIFDHQCFCEEKPPMEVYKCGNEGEKCECKGISVYARKTSDNGTEIPFEEAFKEGEYEFARTNEGITCDELSFHSKDFLPGIQKHCFCDAGVHLHAHYHRVRQERITRWRIRAAKRMEQQLAE
jgi:hypothetical protein